jgi:toxin-antitoxin system PIN domain toxin
LIAVDTNVLIAAHRAEHDFHRPALQRLTEIAEGDAPWGLPVFSIAEFLRVVTHPAVFSPPTPLSTGIEFLERLMKSPTHRLLTPAERYWRHFRGASEAIKAQGNFLFDVQIAAVCMEHGASHIVTADRGFARFPKLTTESLGTLKGPR